MPEDPAAKIVNAAVIPATISVISWEATLTPGSRKVGVEMTTTTSSALITAPISRENTVVPFLGRSGRWGRPVCPYIHDARAA